jgi:hypothetical protein
MSSTYWRSFGMAVTDMQLPPSMLALIKRTLGEEMHSLKYVTFTLGKSPSPTEQETIFGIMDVAKQYSLNQIEFNTACRVFVSRNSPPQTSVTPIVPKKRKPTKFIPSLPHPKPGLVLFRRDARRKGACQVLQVNDDVSTVRWQHNGKLSKIASINLRSQRLFSLTRLY